MQVDDDSSVAHEIEAAAMVTMIRLCLSSYLLDLALIVSFF